jgi:hypothetical protein
MVSSSVKPDKQCAPYIIPTDLGEVPAVFGGFYMAGSGKKNVHGRQR